MRILNSAEQGGAKAYKIGLTAKRLNGFAEKVHVGGERVGEALVLVELGEQLAQDVAAGVVLAAIDLDELGTPKEVRSVAGGGGIFDG